MRSLKVMGLVATALAVTLAATPAFAQSNDNGVGFGVDFGVTRATIHADNASDVYKSRTGLMGGIWFGGNRNGRVGFMGEIDYVVKNSLLSPDQKIKLHYLEIPALFRINIGQKSKNGLSVYPLFGPVVDIQLKSSINGVNIKDQFNGFDFGVMGGLGVEVARFGIEGRGNWGLRSLEKTSGGFGDLQKNKNFTFEVLAKFRIN